MLTTLLMTPFLSADPLTVGDRRPDGVGGGAGLARPLSEPGPGPGPGP